MNNLNIPQGVERCHHCWLTSNTASDYLAFYLCHATIGDAEFSQNPDCLARALLAGLGQPAETLAELQEKIPLLKKPARPSFNEGRDGMIWSE